MYFLTVGVLFLVSSERAVSGLYNGLGVLPVAPVMLHEIDVMDAGAGYRNITVYYTSREPVQIHWTVGDGFNPEVLDKRVQSWKGDNVSRIAVPVDMPDDILSFHVINANQSYEVKVDVSYKTVSDQMEIVDQYDLFIPPETEIGITSQGKSRFHVFVNITNTPYIFGMLQAEMTSVLGDKVNNFAAYSFFPDIRSNPVRVKKTFRTKDEYHAEILLQSRDLNFVGGIVSVSSACSKMSDVIRRMDIKQTVYLHSSPGSSPIPKRSLGFVDIDGPQSLTADKNKKLLIRCNAVGNPQPQVSLFKINGDSGVPAFVPTYLTFLPYQTSAIFQMSNVTMETDGNYACRASNGIKSRDQLITVSAV